MTEKQRFPGNFLTDEIFNPKVKKNLENQGYTEEREKIPVCFGSNFILNNPVDSKNIDRFDKYIQNYEKSKVSNEFAFQKQIFSNANVIRYGLVFSRLL